MVNGVDAGRGFEVDDNSAVILAADGADPIEVPLGPKTVLAAVICDELSRRLRAVDAGLTAVSLVFSPRALCRHTQLSALPHARA